MGVFDKATTAAMWKPPTTHCSPTVSVEILRRETHLLMTDEYAAQYFIHIEVDRRALPLLGPYDEPIGLPEAMQVAAMEVRMNHPRLAAAFK